MEETKRHAKPRTHSDRSPESRENRLVSLAMDLVEERMRNGTATSQEVCHFLKLGSIKSRVEVEKLELEKKLIAAKEENVRAQKEMTTMFSEAIAAMKTYRGESDIDEDDDEEYEGYEQMLF